ncbi:Cof-type HAD-IIB family hydrolase [Liquorilactobacillus mali]|uniref:Cof-type HAD-IIB family hydrolase n=1 Tax=Liquorilactobacillus mali TaxID=1618 RepID=UPI0023502F44|nr:Cof-type HAD-IIB family hydrolase [Liquorilactobacillus mali]MDC7953667.1 HAD family phosphatase [Liquorilactobacillus mali]MDV7758498.1 Cof-type HAD-IIB family hydrolase [Liquorilactobacillus mali]
MYKLIACDLDETLLNDQKKISPKNVQTIKKAVAQGAFFVPNTGRSFLTVQDNLRELGLYQQENSYVISFNGGAIVENQGNQILTTNLLPFEVVKRLFELGVKNNYCIHVYSLDKLYIWNINSEEINYISGRVAEWEELEEDNIDALATTKLVKIIFNIESKKERATIEEEVLRDIDYSLNITFSSDRYIEFNSAKADKGQALIKLGKMLNIQEDEIIAIGDSGNDLAMIKAAGLGAAVANAHELIKENADVITSNDNNNSAVAEVIEKFIL